MYRQYPVILPLYYEGGTMSPELLEEGAEYEYLGGDVKEYQGHRYRFHRLVVDVPVYNKKCLVESLTGPDKGLWFTCSIQNFCTQYRRAPKDQEPVQEVRQVG